MNLDNKRSEEEIKILITGATGLIGQNVIKYLFDELQGKVSIYALVRSIDKAKDIFLSNYDNIHFLQGDILNFDFDDLKIDYIIHAASQTSSRAFVENPVETISVAIDGTRNILDYARKSKVKRFVYLSTMEVYGMPENDNKIDELYPCNLNTMEVRSSYPESKRMCENLCKSYMMEYEVPVNVLRLTQTFGNGVAYNDKRVFAEFARCVIENRDIILKTKGETKRSYLHTYDAAKAIVKVMFDGKPGEAYNVCNPSTYCSIYEMAQLVANEVANGRIAVKIEEDLNNSSGFAPTLHMNLSIGKIESLGWKAEYDLKKMYLDMISDMQGKK